MNSRNTKRFLMTWGLVAVLAAPSVLAAAGIRFGARRMAMTPNTNTCSKARSYAFENGNQDFGSKGYFFAAGYCGYLPNVRATADIGGKLFGKSFQVFSGIARANGGGLRESHMRLVIGEGSVKYTLIDKTDPNKVSITKTKEIKLYEAQTVVIIYGVPVTLKASIAAGLEVSATARSTVSEGQLSGHMKGWIQGTGGAYIGVWCAKVGLESVLRILETTLVANLTAGLSRTTGELKLVFAPVRMLYRACAELCGLKGCITLIDLSLGGYTKTLLQF